MPDSDNVVQFLSRALAGEYPYDPDQIEYRRHPSLARRTATHSRFFVVPDWTDRSIQVGINVISKNARLILNDVEVRHFEVLPLVLHDLRAVPHEECDEEGCDECNMLGQVFEEAKGENAYLLGWLAVTYVG